LYLRISSIGVALILVVGLGRENELSHRPTAAILILRPPEADVLFDNLEIVVGQGQDDETTPPRQPQNIFSQVRIVEDVGVIDN